MFNNLEDLETESFGIRQKRVTVDNECITTWTEIDSGKVLLRVRTFPDTINWQMGNIDYDFWKITLDGQEIDQSGVAAIGNGASVDLHVLLEEQEIRFESRGSRA